MMFFQFLRRCTVFVGIILCGVTLPSETFAAATITVINLDAGNEGFNDATPFTPIGGNAATTLGQARLNAFEHAASIWGAILTSSVEIRVDAAMDPLGAGILGQAGPSTVHQNFTNTPVANTWYVQALANKFSAIDLAPSTSDMSATFSSDFAFYFGLDGNPPSGQYDFVSVVLHELGHGLGFLSLVNPSTGAKFFGVDDAYSRHLEEHDASPADYPTMTDGQRIIASTSGPELHFSGPTVVANSAMLTAGNDSVSGHVEMYAPGTVSSGSSVSHFNKVIKPDQLMEHSMNSGVSFHTVGLAEMLLADLGWDVSLEPTLASPALNSTLTGSAVTFEWTANNQPVTKWWLYVGSAEGAKEIYNSSDLGTNTSVNVQGLPTDGRVLSVRLWYLMDGIWEFADEQFTAVTLAAPVVTSPVPGSTLSSSTATFQWIDNGNVVDRWWLYVGSSLGARDVYNSSDLGTSTSVNVPGLPTDGRMLFVRLWYQNGTVWQFIDEQFTANTLVAPVVTNPVPDSSLNSANVMFQWIANAQSVTNWWLYVGSKVGARDIYNSGDLGTNVSQAVIGLPTDDRILYARLWYRDSVNWQYVDFQYTALSE
jgi:hypothetical protein